jgi:hypothetical protein
MITRLTPVTLANVSPRTLLIRAGTHVFWTNPATGAASEIPAYVADWSMKQADDALLAPKSASPLKEDASSATAHCEGHLWIG